MGVIRAAKTSLRGAYVEALVKKGDVVISRGSHDRATHSLGITVCKAFCLLRMILSILLLTFLFPMTSNADKISGSFFVTEKHFDFTKSILSGKCTGRTPYPVLSHDDEALVDEINDEIFDFVELYAICNQGDKDNFSVSYDLPPSGSDDYFSVVWLTKKDGKLYRIDSLNFNINNAELLVTDDVFNPFSSVMLGELVKLSDGHLPTHFTWENFLDKIGKRDIQYYTKNKQWYIVFNATTQLDKVVNVKIPEYFLKGE